MNSSRGDVTVLLDRLSQGDRTAEEDLMPRVYLELHRIAISRLRTERDGHTLQATDLVHMAYIRLCGVDGVIWRDRLHFFRFAARLMRRILVDYARKHNAVKNNGGLPFAKLENAIAISPDSSADALEVDQLLHQLAAIYPRQAEIVELRFFAGLNEEEIAEALNLSVRTVRRDWLMARAWLYEHWKRD